jgi:hypothetical protein
MTSPYNPNEDMEQAMEDLRRASETPPIEEEFTPSVDDDPVPDELAQNILNALKGPQPEEPAVEEPVAIVPEESNVVEQNLADLATSQATRATQAAPEAEPPPPPAPPSREEQLAAAISARRERKPDGPFEGRNWDKMSQAIHAAVTGGRLGPSFFERDKTPEADPLIGAKLALMRAQTQNAMRGPAPKPQADPQIADSAAALIASDPNISPEQKTALISLAKRDPKLALTKLEAPSTGVRLAEGSKNRIAMALDRKARSWEALSLSQRKHLDAQGEQAMGHLTKYSKAASPIAKPVQSLSEIESLEPGILTDPNFQVPGSTFEVSQDLTNVLNQKLEKLPPGGLVDAVREFKNMVASGTPAEAANKRLAANDPKIAKMDAAIQGLWAGFIKEHSGVAVTKAEMKNLQGVMQQFYGASPVEKLAALQVMRNIYRRQLTADHSTMKAYSKYDDVFKEMYDDSVKGGMLSPDMPIFKNRASDVSSTEKSRTLPSGRRVVLGDDGVWRAE